jgi:hypothetical protein
MLGQKIDPRMCATETARPVRPAAMDSVNRLGKVMYELEQTLNKLRDRLANVPRDCSPDDPNTSPRVTNLTIELFDLAEKAERLHGIADHMLTIVGAG